MVMGLGLAGVTLGPGLVVIVDLLGLAWDGRGIRSRRFLLTGVPAVVLTM